LAALVASGHFGVHELRLSLFLLPGVLVGFLASGLLRPIVDRGHTRPAVLWLSGSLESVRSSRVSCTNGGHFMTATCRLSTCRMQPDHGAALLKLCHSGGCSRSWPNDPFATSGARVASYVLADDVQ